MKKEIQYLLLFKNRIIYLVAIVIIFIIFAYSHFLNNIDGYRGTINAMHFNEGPYRIGGDSRFSSSGVNISTNVYGQNSYCANNPQSTPCKSR